MAKSSADSALRHTLWVAVVKARESGMSEDDISLAVAGTLCRQKAEAYTST